MLRYRYFVLFILMCSPLIGSQVLHLRDNFNKAKAGDYIVTAQDKNYTMLHIRNKEANLVVVDEITVPQNRISLKNHSWRVWMDHDAPCHSGWISYTIDLTTGKIQNVYSQTLQSYCNTECNENLLSKILNLNFTIVPERERKRRGSTSNSSRSPYWQPRMILDGEGINDVSFTPWKAYWPNDGSELAGKKVLIYLPEDNETYPSYFPYWMQISGMVTKAQIRVIDSGHG